jgi:hypothetical protein
MATPGVCEVCGESSANQFGYWCVNCREVQTRLPKFLNSQKGKIYVFDRLMKASYPELYRPKDESED